MEKNVHYPMKRLIIITSAVLLAVTSISCSVRNEGDIPNPGSGEGKGDATNTLRYQNRSVK